MAERILTGIKPTGHLTLGNYIAVLKNLKSMNERGECFIFIADLHALTLPIEPEVLKQNSIDLAAFYLAAGLDPNRRASRNLSWSWASPAATGRLPCAWAPPRGRRNIP